MVVVAVVIVVVAVVAIDVGLGHARPGASHPGRSWGAGGNGLRWQVLEVCIRNMKKCDKMKEKLMEARAMYELKSACVSFVGREGSRRIEKRILLPGVCV